MKPKWHIRLQWSLMATAAPRVRAHEAGGVLPWELCRVPLPPEFGSPGLRSRVQGKAWWTGMEEAPVPVTLLPFSHSLLRAIFAVRLWLLVRALWTFAF